MNTDSKLKLATALIRERAKLSRFVVSFTSVVIAEKICTFVFPDVVTENVSELRLEISISVESSKVEKSPFPEAL